MFEGQPIVMFTLNKEPRNVVQKRLIVKIDLRTAVKYSFYEYVYVYSF